MTISVLRTTVAIYLQFRSVEYAERPFVRVTKAADWLTHCSIGLIRTGMPLRRRCRPDGNLVEYGSRIGGYGEFLRPSTTPCED